MIIEVEYFLGGGKVIARKIQIAIVKNNILKNMFEYFLLDKSCLKFPGENHFFQKLKCNIPLLSGIAYKISFCNHHAYKEVQK
jgi:hypothetical protein